MKTWEVLYTQQRTGGYSTVFGMRLQARDRTAAIKAAIKRLPGAMLWSLDEVDDRGDDDEQDGLDSSL
jgi:hypothetical protein